MTRAAPRNKYHAKAFTDSNGVRWHSQGEFRRWQELRLLEAAKSISNLRRQIPLRLGFAKGGKFIELGKLIVDFAYAEFGQECWEDYKGFQTALSKWKQKHAEAQYGIKIKLTGKL